MKRNFLLMLLLTLLPFAGWAAVDVNVDGYIVTIDKQYLALTDEGVDAPEISVKKTTATFTLADSYVLDNDGFKVEGKIQVEGRYFIVANFTDGETVKVLKVPFYVGTPSNAYDFIKDADSWGYSYESGVLGSYYEKYPFEDLWGHTPGIQEDDRIAQITDRRCEFTSYYDTDTKAATGTVQVLQQGFDAEWNVIWTKVKVLTNDLEEGIPYEMEFVNNVYYVEGDPANAVGEPTKIPLYTQANATGVVSSSAVEHITVTLDSYSAPGFEHAWLGCINAPASKLPWICPTYEGEESMVIVFTYEGKSSVKPWGSTFGENGKKWGVASVAEEFKDNSFMLPEATCPNQTGWTGEKGDASTFDEDKFSMLLVPADIDLTPEIENATDISEVAAYKSEPLAYNGERQTPDFSIYEDEGNAWVWLVSNDASIAEKIYLEEGKDFIAQYDFDSDYKSAGTHYFHIKFIGQYTGTKEVSYDIEKGHVNINLAYIYKTYGDPDPVAPAKPAVNATEEEIEAYESALEAYTAKLGFEIDASTPLYGSDAKSDIAKYLVFKRAKGDVNAGEDVNEYEYYYDKTADYEECDYTFSFLQTKSLLIIQPKAVTIDVTPKFKKYHSTVELKYDADDLKAQLVEADKANASGTPGANDVIKSISWEGAGTDAGEAVNADINGTEIIFRNQSGYPFVVTASTNYAVTVKVPADGFAIIPTDLANITVEIPATEENGAVNGKFVYNGSFQTPAPVVKDGEFTLTDADYYVTYENNQDAGTATCKVHLQGSYTSAQTIDANFTIEKADLIVRPKSVTSVYDYAIEYETFAERQATADDENPTQETAETEYKRASDPAHAYFGVNPENIKVKKGAEIEQDVYRLEIELPAGIERITAKNYNVAIDNETAILALNNKNIVTVRPARGQGKEYDGQEPTEEELEIEVTHGENTAASPEVVAGLSILGKRVYTITKEPGVNVGRYALTVTGPTVLKDFNVVYPATNRTYNITRKNVKMIADDKTKVYGAPIDENFPLTASVEGLVEGENAVDAGFVNGTSYYVTLLRNEGWSYNNNTQVWSNPNESATPGKYTIQVGLFNGSDIGNYHVESRQNGELTVTKKEITVTADDKTKQFGEADPEFTYTVTGATAAQVRDYVDIYREDAEAETAENVGPHTIVVEAAKADDVAVVHPNYNIKFDNGTLTITQATYAVKANDQWVNYGGKINPIDVVITLPGREQPLRWRKTSANETEEQAAEREANNALIAELGRLELVEGITTGTIGANQNAYVWKPNIGGNYIIGTKEVDGQEVPDFTNGYLTVYPLEKIYLAQAALSEITDVPLAQVLEDHKGLEVTVVLPKRAMNEDDWYEWVLPFKVSPRDLFSTPIDEEGNTRWGYGVIDVLDVTKSKNGQVVFDQTVKEIPANTPFIVKIDKKITSSEMAEIEFNNVKIDENATYVDAEGNTVRPAVASNDGSVKFVGLYEDMVGVADNQMFLAQVGDKPKREFYRGGETTTDVRLIRTKAYLEFVSAEAAAGVKIFIQEPDGTYTAINGVEAENVANAEGIYNLSGQRVNKAQKGIFIMDGKKVLVK